MAWCRSGGDLHLQTCSRLLGPERYKCQMHQYGALLHREHSGKYGHRSHNSGLAAAEGMAPERAAVPENSPFDHFLAGRIVSPPTCPSVLYPNNFQIEGSSHSALSVWPYNYGLVTPILLVCYQLQCDISRCQ